MKIQDLVIIGVLFWISYQIYVIQKDLEVDGQMLDHLSAELYEIKNKINDLESKVDDIEFKLI